MPKVAIFDLDGTLLDSVDLHAIAWQEALLRFGHDVNFEQVRSQIGKGPYSCPMKNNGTMVKSWKSGAATISRPSICHLCDLSQLFQTCYVAYGTLDFKWLLLLRPRKMKSTSTWTLLALLTWST